MTAFVENVCRGGLGEVVAEADGQGEDSMGGVGETGRGEDGAGADVGVVEAMEAEVSVDYAGGV
jgi:hypothetical protein